MRARRAETLAAVLVGGLAGALVWATGSLHYDDCDAALFVAGVQDFDPTRNRPHPPGYPLYVLLGKVACRLAGDPFGGLRLVAAVATGTAVALLPAFFRAGGAGRSAAWALALLTAVLPCFWLTGAKVLTDMPGFAAYLATATLLLRRPGAGFGAGLAVGLCTGLRPHFALALLPLLLGRRPVPRLAGAAVGAGAWIGGSAAVVGIPDLLQAANRQVGMRFERPGVSMFSPGEDLGLRVKHHAFELMHDALGVTLLPTRLAAFAVLGLGLVALLRDPLRRPLRPLLGGAVLYGLLVFAFLPADPRYALVAAPALALCATRGEARLAFALALAILPATAGRAILLRTSVPTPESALAWMDRVDPEQSLPCVGAQLAAQVRVLAPARAGPGPATAADLPAEFFVTRRDLDWLGPGLEVEVVDARTFERCRTVHLKDDRLQLLRCRSPAGGPR